MSTSDKDINRLTGKLLKEGMVKPSPDLSLRIMELIMQEEPLKVPEVKKARMSSGMPPFMIVGVIIAYLVVFAGVLMLLGQQSAGSVGGNTRNRKAARMICENHRRKTQARKNYRVASPSGLAANAPFRSALS